MDHPLLTVPPLHSSRRAGSAQLVLHQSDTHVVQAARQAAEQRSQELSDQVDKLTQQASEAAAESQTCLDAAIQKAAKEAEEANVIPIAALHVPWKQSFLVTMASSEHGLS